MAQFASEGCMLECTMGLIPSPFNVIPIGGLVTADAMPLANIESNIPMVNIVSFGMCKSPANPEVAAIIASSLGAVTQAPCIPMTVAPWIPTFPTITINGLPAIDITAKLMCMWGGVISFIAPSQESAMMP